MLHARDSLFSMVRRYTPGVTLARRRWVTWLGGDGRLGSEVMGNLARRCESLEQPESTVRYTPLG